MARKRKKGPRTRSGRLSRAKAYLFDRGTERAQLRQQLFGTDGVDPIGRAYRAGLLGPDGKTLVDTARSLARHFQTYEQARIRCTLDDTPRGRSLGDVVDPEREARLAKREQQFRAVRKWIAGMGRAVNASFEQMVLDNSFADAGPAWLDELIAAKLDGRPLPADAQNRLRLAIKAIEEAARIWD